MLVVPLIQEFKIQWLRFRKDNSLGSSGSSRKYKLLSYIHKEYNEIK